MMKLQYRLTWCSLAILVVGLVNVSSANYIYPDTTTELAYEKMIEDMTIDVNIGEDDEMDKLSGKMKRHTIKGIFDYIYSYIFDYDYSDEDDDDDKKYLICKNCTVVVNQVNQTGNATGILSTPLTTTTLPVVPSTSAPNTQNPSQDAPIPSEPPVAPTTTAAPAPTPAPAPEATTTSA